VSTDLTILPQPCSSRAEGKPVSQDSDPVHTRIRPI